MGKIKGCIFDLDGVIADTARYHFLAWKRLADELGIPFSEAENEQLKGLSRMESLEIILGLAGLALTPEEKESLADKKNRWFNEYIDRMAPDEIFVGVKALIHDLRDHGIRIGLASSSKNARKVISHLGIENEFDAIVDGSMIRHAKPHPEIFLTAAEKLGIKPSACVVIEDAEAGVEAAIAAGMRCIGIGSPVLLERAHKVFPQTADVNVLVLQEMELVNKRGTDP